MDITQVVELALGVAGMVAIFALCVFAASKSR